MKEMTGLSAPIAIADQDQRDILELYDKIQRSKAKLVSSDGKSQNLPESLYSFLVQLIADLRDGNSVSIIQKNAALTTVKAANMLGVSRQFIVNLLDRNEIPFHRVGTHRRIYVRDVLAYKARRDANRSKAMDDLARAEADEGIYDIMESSD